MTKLISLSKSTRPEKKYEVKLLGNSGREITIHFGAAGMLDYTLTPVAEREERKLRYLARHKATEDWTNPETAGFWSRWILWNLPTVSASLQYVKKRFFL
ncbi:MAG: hypothetical protein ACOYNN_08615 [Terrimicrobiaceae bacterium]